MKKYLFLSILCILIMAESLGQIKISAMPTHTSKPVGADVPIVIGGVNKKVKADSIAAIRVAVDSIYRTAGKDSIQFKINGKYYAIKDSAGGTSSTNIYNSDGTLTGNRVLDGDNNTLTFDNLSSFETKQDNDNYLEFTPANKRLDVNIDDNDTRFRLDNLNDIFEVRNAGNNLIYSQGSNMALRGSGGNVGVGTFSPSEVLDVVGNLKVEGSGVGSITARNTANSAEFVWNADNASVSAGLFNENNGTNSVIFGEENHIAAISDAFVSGQSDTVLSTRSAAFGLSNYIGEDAHSSMAWGVGNKCYGEGATAWGVSTIASGGFATAWGNQTIASESYATAWGNQSIASGSYSTAWGNSTKADATNSTAFGLGTIVKEDNQAVLGRYNDTTATGQLFTVGNGVDNSNRSNAMVVLQSGNVGIGTSEPVEALEVVGNALITGGDFYVRHVGIDIFKVESGSVTVQNSTNTLFEFTSDGSFYNTGTGGNGGLKLYSDASGNFNAYSINSNGDFIERFTIQAGQDSVDIHANNTDRFIIDNASHTAKIGINNNSPAYPLDVVGYAQFTRVLLDDGNNGGQIDLQGGAITLVNYDDASGYYHFANGYVTVDGLSGAMGIGTSTPEAKLEVNGDIKGSTIRTSGYTVATLPGGQIGDRAFVVDALTPTYHSPVVGGGAVVTPVFFNGTVWICN